MVQGVEFKLQQVFLNLFLNARDAMLTGGWLRIQTRRVNNEAVVEVADTGAGIPAERGCHGSTIRSSRPKSLDKVRALGAVGDVWCATGATTVQ